MGQLLLYVRKLHDFAGYKLYINMAGMMAVSLLEGAGMFLLIPALGLIGVLSWHPEGIPFLSVLAEPLQGLPETMRLPAVLGGLIILVAGQAWMQRRLGDWNLEIQHGFIRSLRLEVYGGLLQADWPFFLRNRKSDFNHIMTGELSRVSLGTYQSMRLLATLLFTLIQIGLALWLSVPLTLFILLGGIMLALYARRFIRQSKITGDRASELAQAYMAGMTDHFNGMKDIKSNRMEERHLSWFQQLCRQMEDNFVRFGKTQNASQAVYQTASVILIAIFVYVSLAILHVPAERLLLITVLFTRLWPKFSALQSGWEQIAQSLPAFRSLADLQQTSREAREWEWSALASSEIPVRMENELECRGIWHRYDRSRQAYSLQDIHLRIPAHTMTAIVGKSGAGKSTLIDILIGLIRPEKGEVRVDGTAMEHGGGFSLRSSVSYVPQDPVLFHASIRDNLAAAAPDATEEQMWDALAFSASDEFVRRLPGGLDTVLGDRGVNLSGGERQRIVLARAILRKPSLLILDEATSALDSENEAKIQGALERLKGKTTIIVIAHRLSTIRNADQVIVLDQGRIIQQGGFQSLSAETKGTFRQLLEFQAGARA